MESWSQTPNPSSATSSQVSSASSLALLSFGSSSLKWDDEEHIPCGVMRMEGPNTRDKLVTEPSTQCTHTKLGQCYSLCNTIVMIT